MRSWFIIILCIFALCKSVFAAVTFSEGLPRTLPGAALHDMNGREVTLDRLDGNVILVHFWATWCASCIDEMKSLNQLQKLLRKDKVIIIPVSEDFKGADTVRGFYDKFKLNFLPAFMDKNNKWFKEMRVDNLPATFIFDSQGRNVLKMVGEVDWLDEKNIELIKKYISNKQPYNQDYISFIGDYGIASEVAKPHEHAKEGASLLKAIETEVAIKLDDNKIKQGEIGMVSPAENKNFTTRRSVNADIDVRK